MENRASILTKLYFNQFSIDDVSLEQIEQHIKAYPYCQAFYFLKMYKEKELHQISSLSLCTPNPLFAFHLATVSNDFAQRRIEDNTVISSDFSQEMLQTATTDWDEEVFPLLQEKTPATEDKPQDEKKSNSSSTQSGAKASKQASKSNQETSATSKAKKTKPTAKTKDKGHNEKGLKSFLDWLNEINSLSANGHLEKMQEIKVTDEVIENSQQSIRHHEIITESMATVWLEQNQPSKAIEVYQKLSLLFPDKSTYFASKIEEINAEN